MRVPERKVRNDSRAASRVGRSMWGVNLRAREPEGSAAIKIAHTYH